MPIFRCRACGRAITPDLVRRDLVRAVPRTAEPTMARGTYAVDPEPFGAPFVPAEDQDDMPAAMPGITRIDDGVVVVSAGPRDTVVLHPSDADGLLIDPACEEMGCCGRPGDEGNNLVCPCGAQIGVITDDCSTYHELHLDPSHVIG